jgi:hypothetical protein
MWYRQGLMGEFLSQGGSPDMTSHGLRIVLSSHFGPENA